jgi:low affinity Fe/Cu permease
MQSGIFDLTSAWFLRINWKKVFWSGLLSNFFIKENTFNCILTQNMDKSKEYTIDKKLDYLTRVMRETAEHVVNLRFWLSVMMIESWLVSDICVQVEFILFHKWF